MLYKHELVFPQRIELKSNSSVAAYVSTRGDFDARYVAMWRQQRGGGSGVRYVAAASMRRQCGARQQRRRRSGFSHTHVWFSHLTFVARTSHCYISYTASILVRRRCHCFEIIEHRVLNFFWFSCMKICHYLQILKPQFLETLNVDKGHSKIM